MKTTMEKKKKKKKKKKKIGGLGQKKPGPAVKIKKKPA